MIYLYTLIPLVLIDFIWLVLTAAFYKKELAHLFASSFSIYPALVFYPLYALGIVFLVFSPLSKTDASLYIVFLTGALLGLVAYGAYDLTNQATLREWPLLVTIVDMVWGSFVTGLVSVIAISLSKLFS